MAVAYTKRDANQFAKTYRYVRQAPIFNYQFPESVIGDGDPGFIGTPTSVEAKTLYFGGADFVEYTFERTYTTAPHVFVSPSEESMNLHVESVSLGAAVIRSSVASDGYVNIQVVSTLEGDGISTPVLYFAKGKVDITRFAKIYSYIKRQSSLVRLVPTEVIDTGSVFIEPLETEKATGQFLGTSSITYTFERTYSNVPIVILTPDYGVNVFIESVSTTQVVIGSSSESEASVNIQIISTDT